MMDVVGVMDFLDVMGTGGVGGGAWVTVGCPGVSPHPSLVGRCRKKSGDGRGLEKL